MDNSDLQTATKDFRDCCVKLNAALNLEMKNFIALKEKEREIRLKYFVDVTDNKISQAKFKFYLDNETFDERVALSKSKTERMIVENQKESLRERLYSIKKQISII